MLRIAVCDDVPLHMERLAEYMQCWSKNRGMPIQVMKFQSGEEILFEIENSGDFTAVFLDIELSGMNGMETAVKIRKQNRLVSVVFVSQYDIYFREIFSLYPVQFMEKPVSRGKVFFILDQILEEHRYVYESFQFQYKHRAYNINLHEVLYFVSERRTVKILLETGAEYCVYDKLDDIEKMLECYRAPFIRIHQSYLVNGRQIEQYHRRMVMLRNKASLPVSRGRKNAVIQFHMDYLSKRG
ncbi:MAG: LytTR family DNA-binding domain-containing protein [Bacillota bacterium]|nr:LytTR family DNA-binding domain-containing protein [Bacillota bacterium]